jgi:rod shape-determining protein MreC
VRSTIWTSSRRSRSINLRSRKGAIGALLLILFLYLSLFTWNLRTGGLDAISGHTDLEFVGWVLKPGQWTVDKATTLWRDYVYLVDVREENEQLQTRVGQLKLELAKVQEDAAEAQRLRRLMSFAPVPGWSRQGVRVIAHRLGPGAVLDTLTVDKGSSTGVDQNDPVCTEDGVMGRVLRRGLTTATVLLITDINSKLPVLGSKSRVSGVLCGRSDEGMLEVRYVPQNAPLAVGEVLLTSGLAGIFPKGLPVARVVGVERSDISLFLTVRAKPLVDLRNVEEALILHQEAVVSESGPSKAK